MLLLLRLPPPNIPWFGNSLSFVLFHDMGNVFASSSDIWKSAIRIHQPNVQKTIFEELLQIPPEEKQRLLALTPATYIGKAAELARRV